MTRRIEEIGAVQEPDIQVEGENTVIVQLPGVEDEQRAIDAVGQTGVLAFRPVLASAPGTTGPLAGSGTENIDDETGLTIDDDLTADSWLLYEAVPEVLEVGPAGLEGEDVADAVPVFDPTSAVWAVSLDLTSDGADAFAEMTAEAASYPIGDPRRQIAIALDSAIVAAPAVNPDVSPETGITGGQAQITLGQGDDAQEEANELAIVLRYGSLPVDFEVSAVRKVSGTLGADSLQAGVIAGLLGIAVVAVVLLLAYRALGLVAVVGLTVFAALLISIFGLFGEWVGLTLTLAGVTGIIVSIGITADTYIVYFERIKEKLRQGFAVEEATADGFTYRIQDDAHRQHGQPARRRPALGPRSGCGQGLRHLTRHRDRARPDRGPPLHATGCGAACRHPAREPGLVQHRQGGAMSDTSFFRRLDRGETTIDFVGLRRRWYIISAVLIVISLGSLAVRQLNLGIEFVGGLGIQAPNPAGADVPEIRDALSAVGVSSPTIQLFDDGATVRVTTEALDSGQESEVVDAIAEVTGAERSEISLEAVGPSFGALVAQRALLALGVFLGAVILFITWRLEFKMAMTAIVALLHDVIITVGVYSILGFVVTPATVVAILTILGYSLYDGVVVFDKVDELVEIEEDKTYTEIVNLALNQVLARSLFTSLTSLIPVGSILIVGSVILGGPALTEFALALFVGLAASTYSSIFVAAPLLAVWKEKEDFWIGTGGKGVPAEQSEEELIRP